MKPTAVPCPDWLAVHLQQAGGAITFRQFMTLALNDPDHGYYGAGHARIGPDGDFVTSPSLGTDFTALLATQLIQWLKAFPQEMRLSIVEIGPGDGQFAADLIQALSEHAAALLPRVELVLVESAAGMRTRQQQRLDGEDRVPVRWCSLDELRHQPVCGVVVAHELLDALPVERLQLHQGVLHQQMVALDESDRLHWSFRPLPTTLKSDLETTAARCGLRLPPDQAESGWVTEWHSCLPSWFSRVGEILSMGALLVIDYALEAQRYYNPRRGDGTLMAVRDQRAGLHPLDQAGQQDLTAHLCIETVEDAARCNGWRQLGQARQGETLLALGLAQRLHDLQKLPPDQLSQALSRREALLRLVDPAGLGEFRWWLFGRGEPLADFSLAGCSDKPGFAPG